MVDRSASLVEGLPVSVLIVDDDEDILRLLDTLCTALGLEVVGLIQDPLRAIPAVVQKRPDLVLVDQVMPRISGAETAQIIRELVPEVRIVALLASVEQDAPQWCNAALVKTDLDKLSVIVQPLLASVERERKIQGMRAELASVKASLAMTLREWKSLGDERLRGLVGRAAVSLDAMDLAAGRLVREAREGLAAVVLSRELGPDKERWGRARLTVALSQRDEFSYLARVGLQHGDAVLLGESEDVSQDNAVVKATIEAVRPFLEFEVYMIEIDFLQVGEARIAVVVLDRSSDWLVGSAMVRRDIHDSLARATLDAVNRFLKPAEGPAVKVLSAS